MKIIRKKITLCLAKIPHDDQVFIQKHNMKGSVKTPTNLQSKKNLECRYFDKIKRIIRKK